ncbi:uncharacterized protein LOC112575946 isoform X2 [Pomacea canaliculata]|uniref:uncharacterized protein LOC112575946 isoform X2 n=1 Tax=Pomacea canaliculata TaxID=400727 RepID=UPI000D72E31B|nr:uncharacterized protein LOC112575946 isoform X2 [Pomacea canaliculata]
MGDKVRAALVTLMFVVLGPHPHPHHLHRWAAMGMHLAVNPCRDPLVLEAGVPSDITLTLSDAGEADVQLLVMRKPVDIPHFITVCSLEHAGDTCTGSNPDLCQCVVTNGRDLVYRVRKTFSSQDAGLWRFHVCCKQQMNKTVSVQVLSSAPTRQPSPHTTSSKQATYSTRAGHVQWSSVTQMDTLPLTSDPLRGSDVSFLMLLVSLIVVILLVCVIFTAVVWCLLRLYALRQQPCVTTAKPEVGVQPEGNLYEEVLDDSLALSRCTTGDHLLGHKYRHLSTVPSPCGCGDASKVLASDDVVFGVNDRTMSVSTLFPAASGSHYQGCTDRQHSIYLTPSESTK